MKVTHNYQKTSRKVSSFVSSRRAGMAMTRRVLEFRVIEGKQINAKEVMQDQVKLAGSKELYEIVNQHLVNVEYEVNLDEEIFIWRCNFLLENLDYIKRGKAVYFAFLSTQCFDQFISDLEASTVTLCAVRVEIDSVIATNANMKYFIPRKCLYYLHQLHNDDCCRHIDHKVGPCACQRCEGRLGELRHLAGYDHRVAARVEARVRAFFQQCPSLRKECMDRVLELGLELGGLPATAQ